MVNRIIFGELESTSLKLEMLQAEIAEYLRFAARFSKLINEPDVDSEKVDLSHMTNSELLRA